MAVLSCPRIVLAESSEKDTATLRQQFESPPNSAKPYVWWHWNGGDVTDEGIEEDLRWMHAIGIGGVQNFSISLDTPILDFPPLVPWTHPWQHAVRHAIFLSDELGLEFGIASGPGFGETGGPWVTPRQAMKKLVWSELRVRGNTLFKGVVPQPPENPGPFQNAPWSNPLPNGFPPAVKTPDFYRDVALIAFPVSPEDFDLRDLHPQITSSFGPVADGSLWDGDFNTIVHLPLGDDKHQSWIQVDFGRARTICSTSLSLQGTDSYANTNPDLSYLEAKLEYSENGVDFFPSIGIPNTTDIQQTIAFAPIHARYFRLLLPAPPVPKVPAVLAQFGGTPQTEHRVAEWNLYTTPRIHHFETKAGYFIGGTDGTGAPNFTHGSETPSKQVIDLTSKLRADGTLEWKVPPGRWVIQRFGFSLLGNINFPATREQTGLETDKLSASATRDYVNDYLDRYKNTVGPNLVGARGLHAILTDSWELGAQNWTDDLPAQFHKRRGYRLTTWLPTLTGRVVESGEASDRFLWDFRRTLGELLVERYYSEMSRIANQRGLIHYSEAHEAGRAMIADGMDVKSAADVPMGAMWAGNDFVSQTVGDADLIESASVAHTYGRPLIAAESMTMVGNPGHAFASSPESLKLIADREFSDGVNRIVIHTSVHQPLRAAGPGVTLGPYGQWFTRNETWAAQAGPFLTYIARNSYLLQQGRPVVDILYFYGQGSNVTDLYAEHLPPIPRGYSFDFASANVVEELTVHNGTLMSRGGTRYRLLAIDPQVTSISVDVLKRISELVASGAVLVAGKPSITPSLADSAQDFRQLVDAMWAGNDSGPAEHQYGRGEIVTGQPLIVVLTKMLKLQPDFSYSGVDPDLLVSYTHRRLDGGGEIYFLSNPHDRDEHLIAHFRTFGRAPEIWHPDTGTIERHVSYTSDGAGTNVPMSLDAHEALFVVFLDLTSETEHVEPLSSREIIDIVKGSWIVQFENNPEAAHSITLQELRSWSEFTDPAVKYFSGTASYNVSIEAPPNWFTSNRRLLLDLGTVRDVAEVRINGRDVGIYWKTPYVADVTGFLQVGHNTLDVKVTNLWVNRLIGDRQPGASAKAQTSFNPYGTDSQLLQSGLIGPVSVARITTATLQ